MSTIALRLGFGTAPMPMLAGLAWGLAAAAIWGGYLAFARAGVVSGLAPVDFALLRYGTAGLIALPFLLRSGGGGLAAIGWRRAAVLTALAGPPFILLATLGYRYAPLAHGAVVQPSVVVLATMALAVLVLRDRVAASRWAGVAVLLVGLLLVSGAGMDAGGAWRGDLSFAAAGLLWAGFTVLSRRWGVGAWPATLAVAVFGGAVALPLWLVFGDPAALLAQGSRVLLTQAVVQGALSGLLAVYAFGKAIAILGPARAAIVPALVPGLAVLAGIPVAGEWPDAVQWLGLAVVMAGLPLALGLLPRR
jgi:drug/metabolite transporter (DMT)-like permease